MIMDQDAGPALEVTLARLIIDRDHLIDRGLDDHLAKLLECQISGFIIAMRVVFGYQVLHFSKEWADAIQADHFPVPDSLPQ